MSEELRERLDKALKRFERACIRFGSGNGMIDPMQQVHGEDAAKAREEIRDMFVALASEGVGERESSDEQVQCYSTS